ncbi:uncharacterized protein FOMMEDRAFT_151564 [Fomitiporia mediterranea MF3/22]|uniref:uncharacterized protein n=1 Tax=Fomitiporia mediterranea (strain MF3/22) TaxID=694068 RepID=UPI0004408E41|nr:uncharacterized protein FOMMEDRAFT_151564 [Fomitiporia mediterranea MF3/22]EJD06328.1 hypothetical protein FOMMEDRAFT_151564 [Fomitiporia mediterranea MF3/22]
MSVVQLLNEKGHEIMALRYTTVAALALLAYECLITIEAETALIWPSRLSLPKVLFLVNRYVSIATGIVTMYSRFFEMGIFYSYLDALQSLFQTRITAYVTAELNFTWVLFYLSFKKCKTLFIVSGALACSCYVFAEATLFVRAYAVWGRKLSLLVFLSVVLAVSAVGVYYATVQFLLSTEPSPLRVFHSGCLLVTSNRIEWISLIILDWQNDSPREEMLADTTAKSQIASPGIWWKIMSQLPIRVISSSCVKNALYKDA